jgi:hypothetical protein
MYDPVVLVEDWISNEGCRPIDLLLAYHLNFGWPLVGPGSRVARSIRRTEAFDATAASRLGELESFPEPDPLDEELTVLHDVDSVPPWGFALATAEGDLAVAGRWNTEALPILAENRLFRPRDYVLSLEPTNCHLRGTAWEHERGNPRILRPGESAYFRLELRVLCARAEIDSLFSSFPC